MATKHSSIIHQEVDDNQPQSGRLSCLSGLLLTAFIRKAEESALGKLIVEAVILLSARTQNDGGKILRAAAQVYKVDTDAIALKVKHEFAAKAKSKGEKKPQTVAKPTQKRVA